MRRVYRDRETGRFVSKATWSRSKAHGGTRYVRQAVRTQPEEEKPTTETGAEVEQEKVMYRVSIGITYPWRTKDKRGRPGRGRYMAFVATMFFASAREARDSIQYLKHKAYEGLEQALGYEMKDWWFSGKKGMNVEEAAPVPYRANLIGKLELRDEGKDERK